MKTLESPFEINWPQLQKFRSLRGISDWKFYKQRNLKHVHRKFLLEEKNQGNSNHRQENQNEK